MRFPANAGLKTITSRSGSNQNPIKTGKGLNPDYAIGGFYLIFLSFASFAALRETAFFHAKTQSSQRNRNEEKEQTQIQITISNA